MANVGLRAVSDKQVVARPVVPGIVCELGITRLFGRADIGTKGLTEGWSACEDGHNWNDGPDTKLTLSTESVPTEPVVLAIEGLPYLATGVKRQRITLYANGYRVGFWSLAENKIHTLQALIEPEQWLSRDGRGLLKLVWHLEDSVKPIDIGDAQDHRQLGFCFRSLSLESQST